MDGEGCGAWPCMSLQQAADMGIDAAQLGHAPAAHLTQHARQLNHPHVAGSWFRVPHAGFGCRQLQCALPPCIADTK